MSSDKTIAPGHTDLMISPEAIDEYLAQHPPSDADMAPPITLAEIVRAAVEAHARTSKAACGTCR